MIERFSGRLQTSRRLSRRTAPPSSRPDQRAGRVGTRPSLAAELAGTAVHVPLARRLAADDDRTLTAR